MNKNHKRELQAQELARFDKLAASWWDPHGPCHGLHAINPLRLDYIDRRAPLDQDQRVLDVGCGGGILSEGMARKGACVTGIDLSDSGIGCARNHALKEGLDIDYRVSSAEAFLTTSPEPYDRVICMEVVEHVSDPQLLVASCVQLCKPGGMVFFATINRTWRAYLMAITGAEYILRWLPVGTHHYSQLVKPEELGGWAEKAGLETIHAIGMHYRVFSRRYCIAPGTAINYILHGVRQKKSNHP